MINKSQLDWYTLRIFEELVRIRPEWETLAQDYKDRSPETSVFDGFEIVIPCPFPGNPPIEVYITNDADYSWVGYGIGFLGLQDSQWGGGFARHYAGWITDVVDDIKNEKFIDAEWREFEDSDWCAKLIDVEHWRSIQEWVAVLRSVSWAGTFNRLYQGEWESRGG